MKREKAEGRLTIEISGDFSKFIGFADLFDTEAASAFFPFAAGLDIAFAAAFFMIDGSVSSREIELLSIEHARGERIEKSKRPAADGLRRRPQAGQRKVVVWE